MSPILLKPNSGDASEAERQIVDLMFESEDSKKLLRRQCHCGCSEEWDLQPRAEEG